MSANTSFIRSPLWCFQMRLMISAISFFFLFSYSSSSTHFSSSSLYFFSPSACLVPPLSGSSSLSPVLTKDSKSRFSDSSFCSSILTSLLRAQFSRLVCWAREEELSCSMRAKLAFLVISFLSLLTRIWISCSRLRFSRLMLSISSSRHLFSFSLNFSWLSASTARLFAFNNSLSNAFNYAEWSLALTDSGLESSLSFSSPTIDSYRFPFASSSATFSLRAKLFSNSLSYSSLSFDSKLCLSLTAVLQSSSSASISCMYLSLSAAFLRAATSSLLQLSISLLYTSISACAISLSSMSYCCESLSEGDFSGGFYLQEGLFLKLMVFSEGGEAEGDFSFMSFILQNFCYMVLSCSLACNAPSICQGESLRFARMLDVCQLDWLSMTCELLSGLKEWTPLVADFAYDFAQCASDLSSTTIDFSMQERWQ